MITSIVNGYRCRDCTDVGYAAMHIDPAHTRDGPDGIDAPPSSGRAPKPPVKDTDPTGPQLGPVQAGNRDVQQPSGSAVGEGYAAAGQDRQPPLLDTFA